MLNIVIPAAGSGSRFKGTQYGNLPKPMIDVFGKPMIYWAVDSLLQSINLKKEDYRIIFIVREEDVKKHQIDQVIRKNFPDTNLIILEVPIWGTRWQAETVLMAKDLIDNDDHLMVFNCDTICFFEYPVTWRDDGWLVVFHSQDPGMSYILDGGEGSIIVNIVEKEVISNLATTGLYAFKTGSSFVIAAQYIIDQNITTRWEFYVSNTYQYLLAKWKKISYVVAKENIIIGTPVELDVFINHWSHG